MPLHLRRLNEIRPESHDRDEDYAVLMDNGCSIARIYQPPNWANGHWAWFINCDTVGHYAQKDGNAETLAAAKVLVAKNWRTYLAATGRDESYAPPFGFKLDAEAQRRLRLRQRDLIRSAGGLGPT